MTAFESARAIAGVGGAVGYNPEIRLLPSIAQIPKAAWEEMLPGEPECWDFYRTVESIPPPGFTLSAIAAFEDRKILAAAPCSASITGSTRRSRARCERAAIG